MTVIAIDIDGTALCFPEKVNQLYENKDMVIILYTARSESIRTQTENELKQIGIRYHALVMGKLRADVYIDDKNCGGLKWPNE